MRECARGYQLWELVSHAHEHSKTLDGVSDPSLYSHLLNATLSECFSPVTSLGVHAIVGFFSRVVFLIDLDLFSADAVRRLGCGASVRVHAVSHVV